MRYPAFLWLESVVEKIARKHQVRPEEAEEVFANQAQIRRIEKGRVEGEDLYSAFGRSRAGRYLTIFFIRKLDHRFLVVTARDMTRKERRQYGK